MSPSTNTSTSLLMNWFNNGESGKAIGQLNSLVHDVLRHPKFDVDNLKDLDAGRANKQVDDDAKAAFPLLQNFQHTSVDIEVPSGSRNISPHTFSIPGLYYRSLVSVIKAAFADPLSRYFHFAPFKLFHKVHSTAAQIRVFSELYNSDAFISEHDRLQRHGKLPPDDPDCKREKVVAALMFWSDSTHLANFGAAKMWPIYMLFGNLSKYIWAKPSVGAEHHVAYIPTLPDSVQDVLSKFHTKWASQKADILTDCRRELMHAVWKHLLDDEFLHAYKYGIVIKCADGIEHRVYPRLFTYSADYPEKVLLATIKDGGGCPCPRCLVPKSELHLMGYVRDILARVSKARKFLLSAVRFARHNIYELGYGITSEKVKGLLNATSSVPTMNAFIERLGDDFDLHRMLVVDFMHEFELGELVTELDRRYCQMPRFRTDTIHRFATNASEMKKLGARDFEDLLQCAIPAFDGLFPPEHNERGFMDKLKDHLLGRLLNREFDGDTHDEFGPEDRNTVRIIANKIYASKTLRVNYTTYDVRRDQDALNPRTSSFVMVRSPETEAGAHPYWYAQLLGVFRANVFRVTNSSMTSPVLMEFLWVRWLGVEPGYRSGLSRARLPKVGFVPEIDPYAFGFLDPARVVRGSHLIPDFLGAQTNELLTTQDTTAARAPGDTEDWTNYHVNIFMDRDMLMRYFGGGIGHLDTASSEGDCDAEMQDDDEDIDNYNRGDPGDQDDDDDDAEKSDPEEDGEDGADEPGVGDDKPDEEEDEGDFGAMEDEELEEDSGFADF
ncbi:hypothetical protein B0H10DRAFT_2441233 [Mycena sp. CBHHK59/15]|nr:hypothetical protein B0H10DRAFT_2441233 [Mycena sp. CBHHK59/15]